jgi:DNA-binding transcriptional regulator YiaG
MAITLNNHVFKGHKALLGNKYVTFGELELPQRYDIYPVSKNGFDWGNTSKPSKQLAYSMLCQVSNKELALSYAERFLIDIIKNLNSRDWVMSTSEVLEWIDKNNEQQVMQKLQPLKQAEKRVKKPKTNIVKEICKELRITQKNLAEILEVPEGTVSSWAVKNEIPRLGKKAIEFYMLNVKNQKIVDSYRSFKELLEAS